MMILGIDPGAHGGMAFINASGELVELYAFAKFTEQEIAETLFAKSSFVTCSFFEQVGARPGQGVVSMFHFGESCGFVRGCLVSYKIPVTMVTPQKWLAGIGIKKGMDKGDRKRLIRTKAQALYPRHKITLDISDAVMIARYGWQEMVKHRRSTIDDL
jgi:crossover junction endodeoxyribonuclease RuvC